MFTLSIRALQTSRMPLTLRFQFQTKEGSSFAATALPFIVMSKPPASIKLVYGAIFPKGMVPTGWRAVHLKGKATNGPFRMGPVEKLFSQTTHQLAEPPRAYREAHKNITHEETVMVQKAMEARDVPLPPRKKARFDR